MPDPATTIAQMLPASMGVSVPAFPGWPGGENPLSLLGQAAAGGLATAWTSAMTGLWQAGLWLLRLAFSVIDTVTIPDLSADGPLRGALATTSWIGASVTALLLFLQLGLALARRDGQSLGRLLLGMFQFALVWAGFLACAAAAMTAAAALRNGILRATLDVGGLSGIDLAASWPRDVVDVTTATVLGVTSLLLVIPGAFFHLLIALVQSAAMIVLVAVFPITAAGLLHETARAWFWKSLRWSIACVLMPPAEALVLGVGVQVSRSLVNGAGDDSAAVGTAVVGGALVVVGACCPLAVFRLLAFVDPATPTGAAVRQSWNDAGGLPGLLRPAAAVSGSTATAVDPGTGRSHGEADADTRTQSRLAGALGLAGAGMQTAAAVANRATDLAADILGAAGVGSPGYSMTPTDMRRPRMAATGGPAGGGDGGGADDGEPPLPAFDDPWWGGPEPAQPATSPTGGASSGSGPTPANGSGGPASGAGAAGGAAGGAVPPV